MIAKGIENADGIIEACKLALADLDQTETEWREILQSAISIIEDLKTKFFLKTNLAIPITNACRKDVEELKSLVEKRDLSRFPEAMVRFRGNMEKLLKQADMDGVILT